VDLVIPIMTKDKIEKLNFSNNTVQFNNFFRHGVGLNGGLADPKLTEICDIADILGIDLNKCVPAETAGFFPLSYSMDKTVGLGNGTLVDP